MNRFRKSICQIVPVFTLSLIVAAAQAQQLSITNAISSGAAIPGSSDTFDLFGAPVIDNGRLAFVASNGVYSITGNGLEVVADTLGSGGLPALSGVPTVRSNISISGNEVAFFGGTASTASNPSEFGIFVRDLSPGGGLRNVVNSDTVVPGVVGAIAGVTDDFDFFGDFAISEGAVIFAGDNSFPPFPRGVYVEENGVLSIVADQSTPIPGSTASFNGVGIDGDNLLFSSAGVFVSNNGVIETVFNIGSSSFDVSGDNLAQVRNGIFVSIDGVGSQEIETDSTLIPGTTTPFAGVDDVSLDGEDFAFTGLDSFLSNRRLGLYAQINGSLVTVVEEGDTLNGLTVSGIRFSEEGFRDGQIAFQVAFTDNSQGIFVATVIPEPTSVLFLSSVALLSGLRRRRPNA